MAATESQRPARGLSAEKREWPSTWACKNCGKEFVVKERYQPFGRKVLALPLVMFCSDLCDKNWTDATVSAIRRAGLPLIQVDGDFVVCEVCGKRLYRQIGSHMKTHGIQTRGLSQMERNFVLGLNRGERACTSDWVDASREKAIRQQQPLRPPLVITRPDNYGALQRLVPLSESAVRRVRQGSAKGALVLHERACVTRQCKRCGAGFSVKQSMPNAYCSKKCRFGLGPSGNMADEVSAVSELRQQGVPREDIATQLGISLRQVKRRIKQARTHEAQPMAKTEMMTQEVSNA